MPRFHLFIGMLLTVATGAASAQSAADHIAQGDKANAAFHPDTALAQYEAALAADPKNVDALWKASQSAVVLGESFDRPATKPTVETAADLMDTSHAKAVRDSLKEIQDSIAADSITKRGELYEKGEAYARRAIAADSTNPHAQFALIWALGHIVGTVEMMQRGSYSHEIYQHAGTCLKLTPQLPECLHAMGLWNAEVMRIPQELRQAGIQMLGLQELATASWQQATQYLESAVKAQPHRAIHHYDLGRTYADMQETAKAKAEFQAVLDAPVSDFNDPRYKEKAKQALDALAKPATNAAKPSTAGGR